MNTATNTPNPRQTGYKILASGNIAEVAENGDVMFIVPADVYFGFDEGPTCSICDGLGHGYPGGAPCPLEERGAAEAELQDRMEAMAGIF